MEHVAEYDTSVHCAEEDPAGLSDRVGPAQLLFVSKLISIFTCCLPGLKHSEWVMQALREIATPCLCSLDRSGKAVKLPLPKSQGSADCSYDENKQNDLGCMAWPHLASQQKG